MAPPKRKTPLYEQFFSQVEKTETCWIFKGWSTPAGYGRLTGIGAPKRVIYAHRFSYILHYGPIPDKWFVCHKCDDPPCVRPDHLFIGTQMDNLNDMIDKGRGFYRRRAITPEKILQLQARYAQGGITTTELGRQFGICQSYASQLARGVKRRRNKVVRLA